MEHNIRDSLNLSLPAGLQELVGWLRSRGFSSWLVGGAVRNALLSLPPKDWDIITDATEEDLFSSPFKTVGVGARFGVVLVILNDMPVEVACIKKTTPLGTIEADLARRDFTINSIAVSFDSGELVDLFGGLGDLRKGLIRAVEDPKTRFREDPLRVLRAARFASEYGFAVERKTYYAMRDTSVLLDRVAIERVRDEFFRLLAGDHVREGLELLRKSGAFKVIFPEILEGWMKKQNSFHSFHIYRHIVEAVAHAPSRLRIRLAALFHDIAKPRVRRKIDGRFRFFGHEKLGAEMAREILTRWKASKSLVDEVVALVKNHMVHNIDKWSDGAIRRLINRLGTDLLEDFFDLLRADRLAHGVDPADTTDIDLLRKRVQEVGNYPRSLKELTVDGNDVMTILGVGSGPHVGYVLRTLHRHVLDHPEDNSRELLLEMIPKVWESIKVNCKAI